MLKPFNWGKKNYLWDSNHWNDWTVLIRTINERYQFLHWFNCAKINNKDEIFNNVVSSISFQILFLQAFKIIVDSWEFTMLLLYILWDDWQIIMILGSNEQLQQQLEYILRKPDCHCWWISKIRYGREDTLEERYTIKFCIKLGKCHRNVWNASDCFSTILLESSISFWVAKRFKEGRESVRDDERCGRSKEVNTPELIGHRLGLGLGLPCWGFNGVQEEIPSEEASTLEIETVAFSPGQCTTPYLLQTIWPRWASR